MGNSISNIYVLTFCMFSGTKGKFSINDVTYLYDLVRFVLGTRIMINKNDRVMGSLLGFYVGDALAMPVHW